MRTYTKNGFERRNANEFKYEHVECAQRMTYQHLIDDNLEEEGRNETQQLQKQRSNENFAEQMAILVNSAQKPSYAKAPGKLDQTGACRHYHKAAVP